MSRSFDGTDDRIDYGADASINTFVTQTVCMWVKRTATSNPDSLLAKGTMANDWEMFINNVDKFEFGHAWSTAVGEWEVTTPTIGTGLTHLAVTYDGGATTNDPVFYANGVAQTTTEIVAPSGTLNDDAANALLHGERSGGAGDFGGQMSHLVYDNAIYSAADINRCRWWGTRGGTPVVYHPLLTDSLTNKGSGTADGTATGTTVASLPRVERNWGSLMGCGR